MENQTRLFIAGLCIIVFVLCTLYLTSGYGQRKGTVIGWNNIQLGFNIFFDDNETLFLHGDDYRLKEFLGEQDYPMKMTFFYHMQTVGCDTDCGCRTWNHSTRTRF